MDIAVEKLKYRVGPGDPVLLERVEVRARDTDRPIRPLLLQALIQLPRLADPGGEVSADEGDDLLGELARELPPKSEWFVPDVSASPRGLQFRKVTADQAYDITGRFHYLRSPRFDGRAYGLSTDGNRIVAVCVMSPLDVHYLSFMLQAVGRPRETARVVSRVFAFEGAPKNSISYLLSKVAHEELRLGVVDLLTYVNPNMGFTGSSYLASAWHLLGEEPGTKYRYLDGRYITDRDLVTKIDRNSDDGYSRILGNRFAVSRMRLKPLLVFHRCISA